MIEWPLILIGGLAGSSHCLGMCGGFSLMIGMGTNSLSRNLLAQGLYSAGRLFTYATLGAAAGFFGARLQSASVVWFNAPALLSIAAGLFLIYQGLLAAGIRLSWVTGSSSTASPCLMGGFLSGFLRSRSYWNRFLAGVLNGLLPCGLLYGFLAVAGASGDLLTGAGVMALFGAGTVPLMVIAGLTGNLLTAVARQRLLKIAAWCVVLTGMITVVRGAGAWQSERDSGPPPCPFCSARDR